MSEHHSRDSIVDEATTNAEMGWEKILNSDTESQGLKSNDSM
jgi:hypothetical protein